MSVAIADVDNDQAHETQRTDPSNTPILPTNEKIAYTDKLIVHYTHEKRFHSFKRQMHQVYEDVFKNTPAMTVKLIVGSRNRAQARNDLIRKRPMISLLRNRLPTSKCSTFIMREAYNELSLHTQTLLSLGRRRQRLLNRSKPTG